MHGVWGNGSFVGAVAGSWESLFLWISILICLLGFPGVQETGPGNFHFSVLAGAFSSSTATDKPILQLT
jgi:hypothetical protein